MFLYYIIIRLPNSERQREILNDINDLHCSMIKEHDEIREYLQTEAFGENKDKD